jgi:hypothetical protein
MKAYGWVDAYIHVFLISVLDGKGSASGPVRFTPGESWTYAYLINYYDMNSYRGVDVYIHVFLTTVLFGERTASGHGRFTRGESLPYY